MDNRYFPLVVQAVPGENKTVYAYFSDGSIKCYDMSAIVAKGGVFSPLKDDVFFRERLTVLNGTVAWDISGDLDPTACIDIDPFEVYAAPNVEDPLKDTETA